MAAIVLASALVLSFAHQPAWACSCAGFTDQEAFGHADAVFVAEVLPDEGVLPFGSYVEPARERWTFLVSDVYKGQVSELQTALSHPHGATCGLELAHEGPYLVFASRDEPASWNLDSGPGELYVSLCGGTRSVAAAGAVPESFGVPSPPERPEPVTHVAWSSPMDPWVFVAIVAMGTAVVGTIVTVRFVRSR